MEIHQLSITNGEMVDLKSESNGSSCEHLLLSQNHSEVGSQRYVEDPVRAWTDLRHFGTDREEHGSGLDRGVRGPRLFRETGRERPGGACGVDMARPELEDGDMKMFVLARTPLSASMGRWVILSNGKPFDAKKSNC